MIFLKKFANHEEYEAYYEAELENENALRPNISACARIPRECDRVHYNPKIQGLVTFYYNVTNISQPTQLWFQYEVETPFSEVYIDGVKQQDVTGTTYHQFDRTGEHIMQARLIDQNNLPAGLLYSCSAITNIDLPNNITELPEAFFSCCFGLPSFMIPQHISIIGTYCFHSCYALTSVTIPNGVTYIRQAAFGDCTSLSSISIPSSVEIIGVNAFTNCHNLSKVNYDNIESVCSIEVEGSGSYLFDKNHDLYIGGQIATNITIPSSVSAIKHQAFTYANIESITITNTATTIDNFAFGYCTSLTSVTLPSYVTILSSATFANCTALSSITINAPSIGLGCFRDCTSLQTVTLGDSLLTIPMVAFSNCANLSSITVGTGVTNIVGAFANCSSLASFTCKAVTPPTLNAVVLNQIPATCDFYVPSGSVTAYQGAANWSSRASYIHAIPS